MRCALAALLLVANLALLPHLPAQAGNSQGGRNQGGKTTDGKPTDDTDQAELPDQYKRIHQRILKALVNGRLDRARKTLQTHVDRNPKDPEHWFLETLVAAAQKDLAGATRAIGRAIELGLPPERFLAGPRNLLAPLADTAEMAKLRADFAHRPVHGPMLGHLTDRAVSVWLRTATPVPVEVTATPLDGGGAVRTAGRTAADRDFTAVVRLEGLAPKTRYRYALRIAGGEPVPGGTFRTFAPPGEPAVVTLAFGGGAGYVPPHERMWDTIRSFAPDALLLLGDNVYIDAPRMREMQDFCYYRRQSRPEFRQLVAGAAVYSIWDDHDFGVDDCWYGPDPVQPPFKPEVFEVYKRNWANPGYGTGGVPGCFYEFSIGDLYFLMLDGRYYRSDPRIPEPSMLGPAQNAWLRQRLLAAKGVFRMISSPVPWVFEAKGNSRDTWNGFRQERNRIFSFLRDRKIEGVVLLSADRHRTDIWSHPAEGHYPFPEFNSSRLTNQHVHNTMKKAEFSYNAKQSFGLLRFDTTVADPTVTMNVVTIDGEVVYTKVVRRSQLGY